MTSHHQPKLSKLLLFISVVLSTSLRALAATTPFAGAATISRIPTQVAGDSTYTLLGCYIEPAVSPNSRVLGPAGIYFQPSFLNTSVLTVETCLGSCAVGLAADGAGQYTYAGVENSQECFCSLEFASNLTHIVNPAYCTSPCAGNAAEACGGYGYMSTYQLKSSFSNSSSSSTPATSTSTSPTSSSSIAATSSSSHLSGGAIAGIVIGSIIGTTLLICLALYCFRQHKKRKEDRLQIRALAAHNSNINISTTNPPTSPTSTSDTRREGIHTTSPKPWEVQDPNAKTGATSTVSPESMFLATAVAAKPYQTATKEHDSHSPSELDSATTTMAASPAYTPTPHAEHDLLEGFAGTPVVGEQARKVDSRRAGDDDLLRSREGQYPRGMEAREERRGRAELGSGGGGGEASGGGGVSDDGPVLGRRPLTDRVGSNAEGTRMSATGGWSPRETAARRYRENLPPRG